VNSPLLLINPVSEEQPDRAALLARHREWLIANFGRPVDGLGRKFQ
jgi:hypothetical protein